MKRITSLLVAVAVAGSACDLDLQNPNAPTEDEVITTIDGLVALAVGMQGQYAGAVEDFILPSSLGTDEWGTGSRSLLSYRSLMNGESFDPAFAVVEAPWAASYRVIKSANTLLAGAPTLGSGSGLQVGAVALAKLFKAMAYGQLYLNFAEAPVDVGATNPALRPRAEVLDTVLALLEASRADLRTVTDADLAGFRSRIQGTGFDIRNTVHAMLARYYVFAGRDQDAIAAADSVNLAVLSVISYVSPGANPIYDLSTVAQYVYPLQSFVAEAEAGDGRIDYWVDSSQAPAANPPDTLLYGLRRYAGRQDSYHVYLPDEMRLIKAEAFTNLGTLDSAAFYVNAVRTQASSPLDEPVAALPALDPGTDLDTPAELLAQIAYERRYELYMQGLRWEDTRRLGESLTTTPVFPFLPTPQQECNANPNAGC